MTLVLAVAAEAPARAGDQRSAAELWQAYPLQPEGSDAGPGGARADGAAGAGPDLAVDYMGGQSDGARDSRMMLQLAMLFAGLYTMLVCLWFSATRGVLSLGAGPGLRVRRGRAAWTTGAADGHPRAQRRAVARGAGRSRAAADAVWTCAIAWRSGRARSHFRAVVASPDRRRCRVVAQSRPLRWSPRRGGTPPTDEVVSAVDALVAELLAAGWEPVGSAGSWCARRFEWRRDGEPPARLRVGHDAGRPRRR